LIFGEVEVFVKILHETIRNTELKFRKRINQLPKKKKFYIYIYIYILYIYLYTYFPLNLYCTDND
jgi:hypothetical protein